ncbi:MAG: DUF748 domain-containing protein [Planctomycetes bacterium]|nr:DUF748 domain-containing protein [Planctomycetota bacterium]
MSKRDRYEEPAKRRWGLKLGIIVLLLGVVVWFLPAIVGSTSLRNQIVPWAVPELGNSVTLGSASLGWLSPVELRDVALRDPAGGPVLTLPAVTTSRALWQLALQSKNLGTVRLERPELNLVVRNGGSNLEDTLKPLLDAPSKGGPPPSVVLEIVDGRVLLAEALDHESRVPAASTAPDLKSKTPPTASTPAHVASRAVQTGTLDKLNANLTIAPGQPEPLAATVDCLVMSNSAVAGRTLHGEVALKPGTDAAKISPDAGKAALKLAAVDLPALAPLLTRFSVPMKLAGTATTDLKMDWSRDKSGPVVAAEGPLTIHQLAVTSSDYLGPETLRLEKLYVQPQLAYSGSRIDVKGTRAECDIGYVEASGGIDLASWSGTQDTQKALTNLAQSDFQLQGEIDCAALAQRLPGLVRLKADTRIDSGRLTVAIRSSGEASKRRLEGSLKAAKLVATAAGRRIEYPQPIQIDGTLEAPASGSWIGRLNCKSDYLTADAEGSQWDASISIDADLDRLTTDVGQLVDLGQVRAAGHVVAGFEIRRKRPAAGVAAGPTAVSADGHIMLERFQLQAPGLRPWQEPRLTAALKMRGTMDTSTVTRLDEAELRVDSGADHLLAMLAQPLDKPTAESLWPLKASMEGDLAAWLVRVQPWLPLEGWQLAGAARCTAEATVSAKRCDVRQAHLQLQGFKAASSWLTIDEPRIELEAAAQWDGATQLIAVPTMTLATSSVSLRADKIIWQLDPQSRRAGGQVALRGDLARLSRWLEVPGKAPSMRLSGTLLGRVELSEAGGALKAVATAEADDFVAYAPASAPVRTAGPATVPATAGNPWQPVWSEAKIGIAGGTSYRASTDQLELDRFEITSNVLRLANLRGSIDQVSGRQLVDLSGEVHYDLAKITPLLAPYVGQGVRLVGQGHREFALKGPLSSPEATSAVVPPELQGNAGVGFQQAQIYGLTTGAGELKADLKRQIVQFAPVQLAINQGKLMASPRIELMSSPLLVHEPGKVVDQLDITPELCQTWLKYVAPLLADATRVNGKFSLDLSQCRVPLSDTNKSDVSGTLFIHSATVRPGPVAMPIVGVARQIEAVVQKKPLGAVGGLLGGGDGGLVPGSDVQLNIQSQNIQFAVRNGRVTHSPLKFVVGNVEIRTHGSVGFDQTLDLIADVPILPQWVEKQPALRSLSGQTIQIPVRGTLARPALDSRAMESLTRQVGTAAVGGAVEGALQKGLEGLFKPKK